MGRGIQRPLHLMRVAVTTLTVHHGRERNHVLLGMRGFTVARKTLDLLMTKTVHRMQVIAIDMLIHPFTVTIQAHHFIHLAGLTDFILVTRLLAAGIVRQEFLVIDGHETALDDLFGHLVAALTACLRDSAQVVWTLQEMARVAHIFVHSKVLRSFKMAVTGITSQRDAIDGSIDVVAVRKLEAALVNWHGVQFLHTVTPLSHTRGIHNGRVGFGAHASYGTVHRLSQPVDRALDIPVETRLEMAHQTVHLSMV